MDWRRAGPGQSQTVKHILVNIKWKFVNWLIISPPTPFIYSSIHFCQSPLWVCSTKRRHHSPEWMILSHVSCFVQGEVQWFQVLLGSLHLRSIRGRPGGLLQFSKGKLLRFDIGPIKTDFISARQHICYSALYAIVRPSVCLSLRHTGGSVKDGWS